MKKAKGQFNVFAFRWTVSYQDNDGKNLAKSFYKESIAADFAKSVSGIIEVTSWQVRGTLVRDGRKKRLKPVFDNQQKALEEAAELRAEAEGKSKTTVQDLLPTTLAKDAIQANLPGGWSFVGAIKFAREMGYNPNLPRRTVEEAITEYRAWLAAQVEAKMTSQANLDNSTFFLKLVGLYFRGQPIHVLLDKVRVQQFCEGHDPIPCYDPINKDRRFKRKDATESKRPWKSDMQRGVAAAISAMMNRYVRGRYVDKYTTADMFWFPEDKELDPYVMNFSEMRNLLDGAWSMAGGRHASRYILALFGGLRPFEIDSWNDKENKGSYLDLTNGIFYVDIRRKTGCREVTLPFNARLMLQILKKEGRLNADEITSGSNCYRIRRTHKGTLTYFHARLGYRVGENTVARKSISAERFWELNPVKFETGWVQDSPRHTCLDFFYYATNKNAGSTAGYAGHLQTQFYRNYKGKLVTDNIPLIVASFYRLMPAPYRDLETAKDENGEFTIKLPAWYVLKDESALAKEIESMASKLANLNLCSFDGRQGRKVKPLNEFVLIEHSWRVNFADSQGLPQSRVVFKKDEVVKLARHHGVVAEDQLITFPIEKAAMKYVNGYQISVNSWRIEGRVLENGRRVWLRPVRTHKADAQKLLEELMCKYKLQSDEGHEQL